MLHKDCKIYVAGHRGLVGSAIWDNLLERGYTNLVGRTHAELDLLDCVAVKRFFDEERPDAVVLAAAYVGGITYTAKITNLDAGASQTITPSHYLKGSSKIMMVRTYDTAD